MKPEPRKSGMYELPRGSVVGKYEIMRRLAMGGMAEIYLARVTGAAGFEKLVVLKRILPSVAEDPPFVQMFLDEAKIAATLRHPNIADVYDVGESDGTYFFTMEYVYGQDVRSIRHDVRKRNEQIPLAVALAIVHGTASALEHAHEKLGPDGKRLDLVHRDVSASNIMVSYDGAVKLLDFGIARAASSTHKTQTGTLKGKVPYMSPEQCKGQALDRRSDLFSLGTVLYELTVGRRPFRGDSDFEIMDQIVHKGAQPPSHAMAGFPPELEAIIMRLLQRQPAQRYATGEELLHDIDAFIAKHGLWLSARAIGKYMRTLFADKIEAWEHAEQQGVPFAQHVAHSITSQSQRSELVTPPSSFQGLPPRSSEEMMAVARKRSEEMMIATPPRTPSQQIDAESATPALLSRTTSQEMAAVAPPRGPSQAMPVFPPIRPVVESDVMATVEPELPVARVKRGSARTIVLAFAGALVLGVGGVVGFVMSRSDDKAAAVAAPEQATTPMAVQPMAVQPMAVQPTAVQPMAVQPTAVQPMAVSEPAPMGAAPTGAAPKGAAPTVAAPTVATPPAPGVAPPIDKTVAADTKPPTTRKPVIKRKPAVRVIKPKPKPEPKEQTWDPNSPFLPQ